jgi:uncharacterized LabA/DUF88 family protein
MSSDKVRRIAVFYDGTFFWRVSSYFKHKHPVSSFLDIDGLHDYIRQRVAEFEAGGNINLCQIVESHFFRGRFSLKSVQAMVNPAKQLEVDRYQDQILMRSGVVAHYHPMNEVVNPPEEKGVDVWLALEAYDLAVHKGFDVLVLFSGDSDFVPLVRKINGLGTRVLIIGADMEEGAKTSQRLINEASYTLMLSEEVNANAAKSDPFINGLFRQ